MFSYILLISFFWLFGFDKVYGNIVVNTPEKDPDVAELKSIITELKQKYDNLNEHLKTLNKTVESYHAAEADQIDPPQDCADILRRHPDSQSGIYTVNLGPDPRALTTAQVYCDMDTEGGGWTVLQRRQDGHTNFHRTYAAYGEGFGHLDGEFWLGNDKLYMLTSRRNYKLRVDLEDFSGERRYAEYATMSVGSSCDGYRLRVKGYHGDARDSLSYHNGMKFSTFDKDQDVDDRSCASLYEGAWWYRYCHYSNLNGLYLRGSHGSYADGINWYHWKGYHYSLKFTEMKLKPAAVSCNN